MTHTQVNQDQLLPVADWDKVPKPLQLHARWGVYATDSDRNKSINEGPIYIASGCGEPWKRPKNLTTFDEAMGYCKTHPNYTPGYFFTEENRVVTVGLRGCRDPESGQVENWAQEIIESCNTYSEVRSYGCDVRMIGLSQQVASSGYRSRKYC